jgi:hypothetical protein
MDPEFSIIKFNYEHFNNIVDNSEEKKLRNKKK